jgi:hypothetical protein
LVGSLGADAGTDSVGFGSLGADAGTDAVGTAASESTTGGGFFFSLNEDDDELMVESRKENGKREISEFLISVEETREFSFLIGFHTLNRMRKTCGCRCRQRGRFT